MLEMMSISMADYLELKRSILNTRYPLPDCISIAIFGIDKTEMKVNDMLPRIKNRRGAKGEKKKKRKAHKPSNRSKTSNCSNITFGYRKKRNAIQTSKLLIVQTFENYRLYRWSKFFHDDICDFITPETGRGVLRRLADDTTGTYVDVDLKDRGE